MRRLFRKWLIFFAFPTKNNMPAPHLKVGCVVSGSKLGEGIPGTSSENNLEHETDITARTSDLIDDITKPGQEITINIVIHNQEQAKMLLNTFRTKDPKQFGFIVSTWGFGNILAEQERKRFEAIEELHRFNEKMRGLL